MQIIKEINSEGNVIQKTWRLINILLSLWFVIILSSLLTFSLISYTKQSDLNNPYNISGDLEVVPQIGLSSNYTNNVLILFSDGLRYDKLLEANTPNIDQLRTNGVTLSNYRANIPSYSHVNYVAITTGSTPNITEAFTNDYHSMVTLPNLYSLAQDNGYSTGIVTVSHSWFELFGDYWDNYIYMPQYFHELDANYYVANASLVELPTMFSNIQFIALDDTDTAGHEFGADSTEYIDTIELVDQYVGQIIAMYDSLGKLDDTTIVFMSDHGMHDLGQHGGITEQETHATLVLSGKGIQNDSVLITDQYRTNSLIPTLLTILGIPLAPHMNGKIIYDAIDLPTEVKAKYAIQSSEIITQQIEVYLEKIPLITKARRNYYTNIISTLTDSIGESKTTYATNDFITAFQDARENEHNARENLSQLVNEFDNKLSYLRIGIIGSIFVLIIVTLIVVNIRFKENFNIYRILNKKLIIGQISGFAAFIMIHFAFTQYHFAARFLGSIMQLLLPNLYGLIVGIIVATFLPWLITFLVNRKKFSDYKSFKDWKIDFLQSSIGSLILITIVGLGYAIFYIYNFGLFPGVEVPIIGYFFAYMIIGILTAFVALVGLILTIILWISYSKMMKQQWLKEQAAKIYTS